MHISDGILSIEVASVTLLGSAIFCIYSLKTIKYNDIALVSSMSALFFIASFIHIPLGPTQVHLVLIGVIGILLGIHSFLSMTIALFLQAVLLGYGGLTSLGANIIIMALPGYLVYIFNKSIFFIKLNEKVKFFLIGFLGIFFSVMLLSLILFLSKDEYVIASYSILLLNLPLAFLEGVITLFLLLYIKKSIPKLLKEADL